MRAFHAHIRGFSASIRVPFLVSGTQLSCPLPLYSTILGFLGCCAGREVRPDEVRIGFEYSFESETLDPVERLNRLGINSKTGRLEQVKDKGVGQRSFHVNPVLNLYAVGQDVGKWLKKPIGIPCLGRSQDVVWINEVLEIDLNPVDSGNVRGTWLPFSPKGPSGRIMRFVEYYTNNEQGFVRKPGPSSIFVAIPYVESGVFVEQDNLYKDDTMQADQVIYLHRWANNGR